jgi:hypothetical protein
MTQNVPTPPTPPKPEVTPKKKNYKPRVRKSAPAAKPLPKVYIEEKKREIPLYDPFTGEANPYYEQLTGKKNPLNQGKNVLGGGINLKEEQLKNLVPVNVEYGRKNRFLINLPKDMGIPAFLINKISGPKSKYDNVKILGLKSPIKKYIFEDIEINFKIQMFSNVLKTLHVFSSEGKAFNFSVDILDSAAVPYQTWMYSDCLIKEINVEDLSYNSGDFMNCTLKLEVGNYKIK